jgi:hypothetical protein
MRALYIHPRTGDAYAVTDDAIEQPHATPSSSSTSLTSFTSFFARARDWLDSFQ